MTDQLVDDKHIQEKNMFCKWDAISNESTVEKFLVDRLLKHLNYPDNRIRPKEAIDTLDIPKGSKTEEYKPDYVLLDSSDEPVWIIDAKNPDERIEDYLYQVSGYSLLINQRYRNKNPVRYCILTNGRAFAVYPWDSDKPLIYMRFGDFQEDSENIKELESLLSYEAFNQVEDTKDVFEFYRPELGELTDDFKTCHNIIWSKEKIGPTKAFYEFSKLMFLKIRHDQQIHDKIEDSNKEIEKSDFYFSEHWIEQQKQVESHPFKNILFKRLKEDLEKQIRKSNKKRIFGKNEELELKPSTVKEVVKILQNYDLYGIGEDLNGRMFETFLNATIRGEELGQYFTPRGIVKYMVNTVDLEVTKDNVDTVFDGCCGTGGFLIEAMANMLEQADYLKHLSSLEREKLYEKIKNEKIWGVDGSPSISKIGRLNMYLHGDGGNNVFKADTLDKDILIEEGENEEEKEGKKELKEALVEKNKKFDYILTNPPFSMNLSKSNVDGKRKLNQYEIAEYKGSLMSSAKSNVLFLERYKDLLKEDGELFTVIDDTVLNGTGWRNKHFRNYILNNFIIKQIISLPFNTFFKADANIKTSIIHLKKKQEGEKQGEIFMGIANNIGHDDHCESTPDRNNMKMIESYYEEYCKNGEIEDVIVNNQLDWESLSCPMQVFSVSPDELNKDRLDAFYYSPVLNNLRDDIKNLEEEDKIKLNEGKDFNLVENLSKEEREELEDKEVKYVEINDVSPTGEIFNYEESKYGDISTSRAKLQVEEGDVVFPKNISSRGKAFIVPKWFDGNIVTTGFLAIRPHNDKERLALWSFLRSPLFTTQQYYLCVTASQPELRPEVFEEEVLVPIPKSDEMMNLISEKSKEIHNLRQEITETLNSLEKEQVGLLPEEKVNSNSLT